MKIENAKILSMDLIAQDVFKMELSCSFFKEAKPGQFIEISVDGFYLRRPISISSINEGSIVIIFKILGAGTYAMAKLMPGEEISIFGPLGQGFDVSQKDKVLLVGGGVGVPPLYETAKAHLKNKADVTVVLGFNTANDVFYEEAFQKLGCRTYIATMDGSLGIKGTVIDAVNEKGIDRNQFVQACGPIPMLKAVSENFKDGEVSLEARMACGMGACMGCVVKDDKDKYVRVCKDGPVFKIGKVVL